MNAQQIKSRICFAWFPRYWRNLGTLCAAVSPVERVKRERPFDYSRLRVQTVRELMALRESGVQRPLHVSYTALADGANMVSGLSDANTGHFLSAVYCAE